MYLTTKFLEVPKGSRIVSAEVSKEGNYVKLDILSNESIDNTSKDCVEDTRSWEIVRADTVIKILE